MRLFAACLSLLAALAVWTQPALAHPHVWVTSTSELIYGADGAITGSQDIITAEPVLPGFSCPVSRFF